MITNTWFRDTGQTRTHLGKLRVCAGGVDDGLARLTSGELIRRPLGRYEGLVGRKRNTSVCRLAPPFLLPGEGRTEERECLQAQTAQMA